MTDPIVNNTLRGVIDANGGNLKDCTVLAPCNDPYRNDTPAGHRDGAWLANTLAGLGVSGQRHLRGLHYILVGGDVTKPNGQRYANTEPDWIWLGKAAKAARWLRYIPFNRIVDQRNDEPVIRRLTPTQPHAVVNVDLDVVIPSEEDLEPTVGLRDFVPTQPYRLVLIGEKSSLRPVLEPVADRYGADLYLPTGEISDTQMWMMARDGASDGRPMAVLYFADCDPAGWQMAVSVSRKLQALRDLEFGDLNFEVHRVALTPDQVREYGLPSTPLKASEKRADDWTRAMGVQQTEIDALAALQPNLLSRLAADAIAPFHDSDLAWRARRISEDWVEAAQRAVDEQAGSEQLAWLRDGAAARLQELRARIDEVLDEVSVDGDAFDLPDIPALPEPEPAGERPDPLIDSRWDFKTQCEALIKSKAYADTTTTERTAP